MDELSFTIQIGMKVKIIRSVCSQDFQRRLLAAPAVLTVDSKENDLTWNLKDVSGTIYPNVPEQYLVPIG